MSLYNNQVTHQPIDPCLWGEFSHDTLKNTPEDNLDLPMTILLTNKIMETCIKNPNRLKSLLVHINAQPCFLIIHQQIEDKNPILQCKFQKIRKSALMTLPTISNNK